MANERDYFISENKELRQNQLILEEDVKELNMIIRDQWDKDRPRDRLRVTFTGDINGVKVFCKGLMPPRNGQKPHVCKHCKSMIYCGTTQVAMMRAINC